MAEVWNHDQIRMKNRFVFNAPITFDDNDESPTVINGSLFLTATGHSSAKNITDFDNGVPGQIIIIVASNPANKTTLVDGGQLLLNGNWTEAAGSTITLINVEGGNWYEVARTP